MFERQETIAHLPLIIREALTRFVEALTIQCGENLRAILLYGSAARKDYKHGISNLNLLAVFTDAHISEIRKAGAIGRRFLRRHRFEPRFMSLAALRSTALLLPMVLIDIQEAYCLLHGEDLIRGIPIRRDNLKLQCGLQLRSFLQRLRHVYLLESNDKRDLRDMLIRSFTGFLHILKNVFRMMGETPPVTREEIVERSVVRFHLDAGIMSRLLALKLGSQRIGRRDLSGLLEGYLDLLYDFIPHVDALEVKAE